MPAYWVGMSHIHPLLRRLLQFGAVILLLLLTIPVGRFAAVRFVLPYSPPLKDVLPSGIEVVVPDEPEAAFAAEQAAALRQFLFARHNQFERADLVAAGGIVPVAAGTRVRAVRSDADMVRVRFLEGEYQDRELWMKSKPLLESLRTPR